LNGVNVGKGKSEDLRFLRIRGKVRVKVIVSKGFMKENKVRIYE